MTRNAKAPEKRATSDIRQPSFVVGIGASAGGLEALRQLIGQLPVATGVAYLVAQHLSPQHRSLLTELLSRETKLAVIEASGGEPLEANTIYICPANADLASVDYKLKLSVPTRSIGPKPSIDHLFGSLAESYGDHAVGIILSGTGSDGAHGSRAIRAAGGLTIAQDPQTAQYDAMPKAAIETGGAELVLAPGAIGAQLGALLKLPRLREDYTATLPDAQSGPLGDIISGIWRNLKLDFAKYKQSTICRQIDRRIVALQLENIEHYASYLSKNPDEYKALARSFMVSVTSFFRDRNAFDAIERALDQHFDRKRADEPIRVWVPGCATGEEAYSLAILVQELMRKRIENRPVQIFATDIDTDATAHARRGIYPEAALQDVPDEIVKRYFSQTSSGFRVQPNVAEMVMFARQDLTRDPPFLRLDLISCRNVLIYFKPELQEHLFRVFHYSLNAGGTLFLGKSEVLTGAAGLFNPSPQGERIFVRNDLATSSPLSLSSYRPSFEFSFVGRKPKAAPPDPKALMREQLTRRFAPASVLIDATNRMVELSGNTKPFFQFAEGSANLDCLSLIRPELRTELRALIHRTRDGKTPETAGRVFSLEEGAFQMQVFDLQSAEQAGAVTLVAFVPKETRPPLPRSSNSELTDGETEQHVRELEDELATTREHLHSVIEELEVSNEELQSLNEELQASGEELQASNEELATSNEELQATNEELSTVNDELQAKSQELGDAFTDLENIQDAAAVALIVVNQDFLVTRFNTKAVRMIGLTDADVGRNLTTLPIRLPIPDLHGLLTAALNGDRVKPLDIESGGQIYTVEVQPYTSEKNTNQGVVITLADVTELKHAQAALQQIHDLFTILTDNQDAVIWVQEPNFGRFVYVSPGYRNVYGLDPELLLRDPEHMLKVVHRDDAEHLKQISRRARAEPWTMRLRMTHPADGSLRWLHTRAYPYKVGGALRYYTGVTLDVTAEVNQLGQNENFGLIFDALIDSAADAVLGFDAEGHVTFANARACDLFGEEEGSLKTRVASDLLLDEHAALLLASATSGQAIRRPMIRGPIKRADGGQIVSEIMISADPILRGTKSAAIVVFRAAGTGETASQHQALASAAFENAPDGMLLLGADTRVITANPAALVMLALESTSLIGRVPELFRPVTGNSAFPPNVWHQLRSAGRWAGEIHTQRGDGSFAVLDLTISELEHTHGNEPGWFLVVMTDATVGHKERTTALQQAHHDSLTGLPNRRLMVDSLDQELRHAEREGYGVTLMFIDLDRFKEINDSLGHEAGDALLVQAAHRIREGVRASDTVARFGGDEFVILLPKYQRSQAPELIARQLVASLETPFDFKGQKLYVSASIGIAVYPHDGVSSSDLLRNADAAMYKAKQAGRRGFAFYQPELNLEARRRMTLESELHSAIANNELHVYYQPIIDVASREVKSLEALVRWQHPKRGLLTPGAFIDYAIDIGRIDDITKVVLKDARRNLATWRQEIAPGLRVTVNLCARQFRSDTLKALFEDTGSNLDAFVFEITETVLEQGEETAAFDSIRWLQSCGALIALDDFGTGYSSLSRVRRFPVDIIKIDREFVIESAINPRDAALVGAVVTMAHGVEATVVAEGVDSERQARLMEALNVDAIQGYYYSEPMPAHDATTYLRERKELLKKEASQPKTSSAH
ncbi:MAG: EAL domain-containing protein [Rhodocyclaceae bacterium]|nr:EAL domain-containing protein [Rhodocyclaceae bacterium]